MSVQDSTVSLMTSVEIVQGNHRFHFHLFHISGYMCAKLHLLVCNIVAACTLSVSEEESTAALTHNCIGFAAEVSHVASTDSKQHCM